MANNGGGSSNGAASSTSRSPFGAVEPRRSPPAAVNNQQSPRGPPAAQPHQRQASSTLDESNRHDPPGVRTPPRLSSATVPAGAASARPTDSSGIPVFAHHACDRISPPPGWAHSTALHQLTWVVSIDDWENQPELAAPDYVDPYPANGVLPMADCWNTTASGFTEIRTSLRIVVGKDNSNQASNQRPCKWVGIYTITTTTVAPVYVAMSQVLGCPVPALVTQPVTHAKAEWMAWTTFVQQHWPAIRNFDFVRPSREHALIPAQHRCFNGVRTRRDHPNLQTAAISYIAWTPDEDGTNDALENHLQSQGLDDENYRTWLCNIVPTLE